MTSRKDFLVAGSIAAALPANALAAAPETGTHPKAPELHFDLGAFTALLDGPQKYKNLFAACVINGGEVLAAMRNTLNAYRDVGVSWGDVLPVAVLYHGFAVLLALDDTMWNEYVIPFSGKLPKANPNAAQIASLREEGGNGNPRLREQGGDDDTSIRSLIADANARFFVCNNAALGIASIMGKALGISFETVYNDLARHLVPNTMIVPAGVWAVHVIQDQRFTLLHTSLATNA